MTKSRSFSIYLLKEDYDPTNSLREDHTLVENSDAKALPEGSVLYILDGIPKQPWWRAYFGVEKNLAQVSKGALIFLPAGNRYFALSFGHVAHNLRETSFEYDFGLRVTLNSLDPHKLKSTDTLDPSAAKRQRTQFPIESELTLFDFDRDSTILRSLTGKVREEYKDLFRHASGSSNLRISSDVSAEKLVWLCDRLLQLYSNDDYIVTFPEIQNISPVRDPITIETLNQSLLGAFQRNDTDLNLTVPDIVNYSDNIYVTFSGLGKGLIYDDVYIGRYYEYLGRHDSDTASMTIDNLQHHSLVLTDENGNPRDRYSIFKSLVFDLTLEEAGREVFHLCEGNWYSINKDYITRLSNYLNPLFEDCDLPPYDHASEGGYNIAVAKNSSTNFICLDRKNISPNSQSQIEPCDLLEIRDEVAAFYHIKVSTLSTQLSHLFNQGVNAFELMRLEPEAVDKLEALIRDNLGEAEADHLISLVRSQRFCIIFGIVSKKDPGGRSQNLPLFSRISLMRSMKALRLMDVPATVAFIKDESVQNTGRKKERKVASAKPIPTTTAEWLAAL
ncbi:MAG TPA: DUF6119 family protein [Aliidongia sp.]|nr:DUF6119 family protein [Aliidongia sp.]